MKTIKNKLLVYFLVFAGLFNMVSASIYVSSSQLMQEYHTSFEKFLLLNSISQLSNLLSENTKVFVVEQEKERLTNYYDALNELKEEKDKIEYNKGDIQKKNYLNLIESLIYQSELTIGFVLRDDIERYTSHLNEVQNTASYIQETTLRLIDIELTDYQAFFNDLQTRNDTFRLFILFLSITTFLLATFIAIHFAQEINKPVQQLSAAAKEVSSGDFQGQPVAITSNDELRLLGDTFNNMRVNLRDLIEEMKDKSEQERLMKELELKHLQNQINPHFLFNTLNTISKMAYLEEAKTTSNLIDSVATILRYSLGDVESFVRLKDEVYVVQEYLNIQKIRFLERIHFSMSIEEKCLDIPIPRLTLQPIIENAFIHGLENLERGGTIQLLIYEDKEQVVVEVIDNGIGMTEKQKNRILSEESESDHVGHSTGLGMVNVIRRLQLFYQRENVIEIQSKVDKGTSIRLLLPKDFDISRIDK